MLNRIARIPWWAYLNTALLLGPTALGIGIFRLWFAPKPELLLPAFGALLIYYPSALYVAKRTSGAEQPWGKVGALHLTWQSRVRAVVGGVVFLLLGYAAFYVSIPAILTQLAGRDVSKQVTVTAAYKAFRTVGCRYEIHFAEIPAPLGGGFCVPIRKFDRAWVKGTRVTLYGRESALGFRFTDIGPNNAWSGP